MVSQTNDSRAITSTPGAAATGIAGFIYGMGVAFLPESLGTLKDWWLYGGAAVVGVMFLIFLVVPMVKRAIRGDAR